MIKTKTICALRKAVSALIFVCFLSTTVIPPSYAQEMFLPIPGTMVHLSPAFAPAMLKGIKVYPDNPFLFDFILDKGDSKIANQDEASKLVKYFLASLTTPEKEMWVNLSPYEKDRIVPESFGQTEMGRDLLAQDYILKQITASLIYPEDELGKKFWARINAEAKKKFGTTDIPMNTFNKVWIVPEKAVVYENPQTASAYVIESSLKVMLEEDYVAMQKSIPLRGGEADEALAKSAESFADAAASESSASTQGARQSVLTEVAASPMAPRNDVSAIGSQIIREIVIPELTKEVNSGKNFSQLRQIYNSLILAEWYKRKIKSSILAQVYVDKNKVVGVQYDSSIARSPEGTTKQSISADFASPPMEDRNDVNLIYERYLEAFKKGAYNYIKEEYDSVTQETIPKKYFSGGFSAQNFGAISAIEISTDFQKVRASAATEFEQDQTVRVRIASSSTLSVQQGQRFVAKAAMPIIKTRQNININKEIMFQLERNEYWDAYEKFIVAAIKKGMFVKDDSNLIYALELLDNQSQGVAYSQIVIAAIKKGLLAKKNWRLEYGLGRLKKQELSQALVVAIEKGLLDQNSKLFDQGLNNLQRAQAWISYSQVIVAAMEKGTLAKGDWRLGVVLEKLVELNEWHRYSQVIIAAIKNGYFDKDSPLFISGLEKLENSPDRNSSIQVVIAAIEKGFLATNDPLFASGLEKLAQSAPRSLFVKTVISVIEKGLLSKDNSSLDVGLKMLAVAENWTQYSQIIIAAIENGLIVNDDLLFVKALQDLTSNQEWALLSEVIVATIAKGLLAQNDPLIINTLKNLEENDLWEEYSQVVIAAIEHGLFAKDDPRLDFGLNMLYEFDVLYEFGPIVIDAMEKGLLAKDDPRLELALNMLADSNDWLPYTQNIKHAIKKRLFAQNDPRLINALKKLAGQRMDESGYGQVLVAAVQSQLLTIDDAMIEEIGRKYKDTEQWVVGYAEKVTLMMESDLFVFDHSYYQEQQQRAKEDSLPLSIVNVLDAVEDGLGIEQRQKAQGFIKSIIGKIKEMNKEQDLRGDQRIDVLQAEEYLLAGLVKIWVISESVAGQIVDNYLNQRGYLPLFKEVIETAAFLDMSEVALFREFYQQSDPVFVNQPSLLINLIGYLDAYQQLNLGVEQFANDLLLPVQNTAELTRRLGVRVFEILASSLDLSVDSNRLDGHVDHLQEWNLKYLGVLMATQGAWTDEERKFFKVLLKASLEGKESALVKPEEYELIDISVLGDESSDVVERTRTHNLRLLKLMEDSGLNVNAWIQPNSTVAPVALYEEGAQRSAKSIVQEFRKRFFGLADLVKEDESFERVRKSIGPWANVNERSNPINMINGRELLQGLRKYVEKKQSEFVVGEVPEVLADMERILQEINNYDQAKPSVKEFFTISFFERKVGQDMFLGNCAGSCTSLGINAAAVFQFILDQGTMYAVIKNEKNEVKGYARFFVGIGRDGKPLLFIDSIDGTAALAHEERLKEHIQKLAQKTGFFKEKVYDRVDGIVEQKMGGALLDGYFHHAGTMEIELGHTESLNDWAPSGGWVRASTDVRMIAPNTLTPQQMRVVITEAYVNGKIKDNEEFFSDWQRKWEDKPAVKVAGGIILRKVLIDGEYQWAILVGQRGDGASDRQKLYTPPAGGVKAGESFASAGRREIQEETGLNLQDPAGYINYYIGDADNIMIRLGVYIDESVEDPKVNDKNELTNFQWVPASFFLTGDKAEVNHNVVTFLKADVMKGLSEGAGFEQIAHFLRTVLEDKAIKASSAVMQPAMVFPSGGKFFTKYRVTEKFLKDSNGKLRLSDDSAGELVLKPSHYEFHTTPLKTIQYQIGVDIVEKILELNEERRKSGNLDRTITVLDWGAGAGTALMEIRAKLDRIGIRNVRLVGFGDSPDRAWFDLRDGSDMIFGKDYEISLYFLPGEIDIIYTSNALRYLNATQYYKQLAELLRPGGKIFWDGDVEDVKDIEATGLKWGSESSQLRAYFETANYLYKPVASSAIDTETKGGIDFNADNLNLETRMDSRFRGNDNVGRGNDNVGRWNDSEIQFQINPQQLLELQNTPGFTPVIINIQPMGNLHMFLGLNKDSSPIEKVSMR